jgi:hypothetical protein
LRLDAAVNADPLLTASRDGRQGAAAVVDDTLRVFALP